MNNWININERLPVSGVHDERCALPFHEEEVEVLINGKDIEDALFYACWDDDEFIMAFDTDNVTHWRYRGGSDE